MNRKAVYFCLILVGFAFLPRPLPAEDILQFIETPDLRLLYLDPTETYLVPHVARSFENSLEGQRAIFGYEPTEKVTTLLVDFVDYGNAGAIPVPRNSVVVDIAPKLFTFETSAPAERMFTWMNHELVHLVATDMAAEEDRFWRRLFGGKVMATADHPETMLYSYLTMPRLASPRWYHEGIATFTQTWMAGGLGRAQGAYDEMVFRAMVRDDAHFYDPLGLVAEGTKVDFQVGVNAYLYGTRFMSYLALAYSPRHLVDWTARTDGSRRHYSAQFEQVFGKPLDEAWAEWVAWEHEFQRANLRSIRQHPTTAYRDLSVHPLGSVSRAFFDEDSRRILAGVRYPGVVAHIASISENEPFIDRLEDIKGPLLFKVTSPAYDPGTQTLFYTADNGAMRDVVALDLPSGESTVLLPDARIGELVFNPADRSLWGVRHLNGLATLVRVPFPYEQWEQVRTLPFGEILYDLDISPDGSLLSTSFGEVNGDQSLRIYRIESLLAGGMEEVGRFDFGQAVPESFVFSPDGRYLYGSSYYTGVSNIFRYELETGAVEAVSNAETGFFRPMPREDGSLVVFRYSGQGFIPAVIDPVPLENLSAITFLGTQVVASHPVLKQWRAGSPGDIPLDEKITDEGGYRVWENMELESVYPVLEGYRSSVGAGVAADFGDPIGFSRLGVSASVTPGQSSDEAGHVYIKHEYQRLDQLLPGSWTTELKYNYADFYDIFGPTRVSKKGYSGEVTYERPIIYDEPRELDLTVKAGYFGNLDEVPYAQDVAATFDSLANASARLDYSFVRRSLGAVDDEKGHKWSLVTGGNYANSSLTPYGYGKLDLGWALPLAHSSIWWRNAAGFAIGDKEEEFSNFYFGGFRNNYVDHRDPKRYREPFSLPGFDIDELDGRNFGRSLLEWNLPPARFDRVGSPDAYLSWMRPAIFAAALVTDMDTDSDSYYSFGAQLDFQFTILSRMDMMLSVGYAAGFEGSSHETDDVMLSLKIL
ncbi:MAG: hypothetical protein P8102_13680 [Gammaproteobacteria bacterium]